MAMLIDAAVGAIVGELLSAVFVMKDKAVKFRPTLERLETTLRRIQPVIEEIEKYNKQLDRPKEEMETLIKELKEGKNLILKCSEVQWWECCYKPHYQEELEELDESLRRFFDFDMQAQIARDQKEVLVVVRDIHKLIPRNDRIELRGPCSAPEPPAFTVGLDVPLEEVKRKLLQVDCSMLVVTGSGASGKTTLAKKICWDETVKGIFNEKIFFITISKTPKLNIIVQKLFQHNNRQVPELQSDEDAINQLGHLLKEIGTSPMLFVLDDVWPGSESLVENIMVQMSDYKILVTSRSAIRRFGPPYYLKFLSDEDSIKLFNHSASLKESSSDIPDDLVRQIVRGCGGCPLALKLMGRSLCKQPLVVWHSRAREFSKGHSILDSNIDLLDCLQKSLDVSDAKGTIKECFKDLGLFPENQRIPAAALIDMWEELHDDDDLSALEKIDELDNRNMADIIVRRKATTDEFYYNCDFVTQHNLLRELAIHQSSQEPVAQRSRLIIETDGNNLPKWWTVQNEYHIAARLLSISTDEAFTSDWCNLQPVEVEVLVLNLRAKKYTLPKFMEKMSKLKVLIITNYGFYPADLENFELISSLSNLKRLRLEHVRVPSLSKTRAQLKNLQKLSIFMCNVNEAFKSGTIQVPDLLPNLVEMNIDYCNMVALPDGLCDMVFLKKLSITNCHKLSGLPEEIGKLINLELLRLSSCTHIEELPDSITRLRKLELLDISYCISLSKLPELMGELHNLEKLNIRGCSRLSELPPSIMDLGSLKVVVCDEERAALWENFETILSGLRIEVAEADYNLNWLAP